MSLLWEVNSAPGVGTMPDPLANNRIVDSPSAAEGTDGGALLDYLNGLLSSTGQNILSAQQYNSQEAEAARKFQHDEAALQRQWYEDLSSSAYQRAVVDLKKAGLNPALAYSQGGAASASTGVPAGAAASINAVAGDTIGSIVGDIADLISSIMSSGKKNQKKEVTNNITNVYKNSAKQ